MTSTRLEAGSIVSAVATTSLRCADAARGRSVLDVEEAIKAENDVALRATDLVEVGLEFERTFGLEGWRGWLPKLAVLARDLEAVPC